MPLGLKILIKFSKNVGYSKFIRFFLKYIWRNIISIPFMPYFINKIRTLDLKEKEKILSFTYVFGYGLIQPVQKPNELKNLIKIIDDQKPEIIMEIGTASGGMLFLFSRFARRNANLISIDLPRGKFGGGYSRFRIPLYKAFAIDKQKIFLLREDSHNKNTVDKVKKLLNKREIDFLFIDGDHTYKGVKKDFEMYQHFVKKNGLIAFHDIISSNVNIEVDKFWNEIKSQYNYFEIINDENQKWGGIGIIKK